jgi:hypothetical protein
MTRSISWPRAVSMRMGVVRPSFRSFRHSSNSFIYGSITSRTMRSDAFVDEAVPGLRVAGGNLLVGILRKTLLAIRVDRQWVSMDTSWRAASVRREWQAAQVPDPTTLGYW